MSTAEWRLFSGKAVIVQANMAEISMQMDITLTLSHAAFPVNVYKNWHFE